MKFHGLYEDAGSNYSLVCWFMRLRMQVQVQMQEQVHVQVHVPNFVVCKFMRLSVPDLHNVIFLH